MVRSKTGIIAFALALALATPATNFARSSTRLIAGTPEASHPVVPGRVTAGGLDDSASTTIKGHSSYEAPDFLVTTTSSAENYKIVEYKGIVVGAAVREPTWSEDASAGLKEPYGGSLDSYVQMCEEARQQAFTSLVSRAREAGANGVIGVHFDSSSFPLNRGHFASSVVCVGTAVIVKKIR